MTSEDTISNCNSKMRKAYEIFTHDLASLRTGRANVSMLDIIKAEVYGQKMSINQLATISTPDPRLITVQVWDQNNVSLIDAAIKKSNLGINPQIEGQLMRIPIPSLNEERRFELKKIMGSLAEKAKISIRNIRREANDNLKEDLKDKKLGEDEYKSYEKKIQNLAKNDFLSFVKCVWPEFIEGPHHRHVAEKFNKLATGELKRLIINMPPRHTKSEFASFLLPAWMVGRNPKLKIIQATHTGELAIKFGRKAKHLIDSEEYHKIFDTRLVSLSEMLGIENLIFSFILFLITLVVSTILSSLFNTPLNKSVIKSAPTISCPPYIDSCICSFQEFNFEGSNLFNGIILSF